ATPEDGGHAASGGGTGRFPLPPLFARMCRASASVSSPTSWGTDPVGQFPVRTTLMTASAARSMLERISQPSDLRQLSPDELVELCEEIREVILEKVSMTGGHLYPHPGVVELTVALHRSFDSPQDRFIWDVGHQAYV